jgi:flagellar hook-associated protein 2
VVSRTQAVDAERLAITKLTSLVLAFEFEVNRLGSSTLYDGKTVTSSDPASLKAVLTEGGNPAIGTYQFRPLQTAAAQQLASASLQSVSDLSDDGIFKFGFGGFVDKGIALTELNSGAGVRAGTIRITDRAGDAVDIDLRTARTVDGVIRAINSNTFASVTASADGDRFVLTDTSGGSGNLKVQDVGTGKAALDLGLAGINVAANTATGADVFQLHTETELTTLNDGTGVPLASGNDLAITLIDETTLNVDLGAAATLGDVIAALNAANPAKLSAAIAADGNRIELTDLTSGAGTFAVANVGTGTAADALGLTVDAAGDTISGRRLVSGLRDTLAASLRGGQGLGNTLGVVDITNRNNVTSNVDLSGAETLGEIVAAINDQATGVTAAINSARNGIVLTDTTGATASNLIVVDGDASETATALGLVADVEATTVNSGSLDRQQVGRATLLSSLNGGEGVDLGDLRITDSDGAGGAIDLNSSGSEATTLGDVIDRINALTSVNVEARINDTGDGILIVDNAAGDGTLKVENVGSHTTAEDLRLAGAAAERDFGGTTKQVIDGATSYSIDLSDLEDVAEQISLASFNDGEGVAHGSFKITDTNGNSAAIFVNSSVTTVADVIEAINAKEIGVEARINDAGTGILLYDTVFGNENLKVEELAGGSVAAHLGLDAAPKTVTIDGQARQSINGAGAFSQSAAQTGLEVLADRINSLEAGVTASTLYDGTGYRLMLTVEKMGAGHELLVDGNAAGLSFDEIEAGRDAILEIGGLTGSGLLVTSSDNTFDDIVPGLELTVLAASTQNVNVDVSKSQSQITDTVQDFIDAFNSVRANLDEVTSFDAESQTTGILFGTTAALRVESDLNHVLSGRFFGTGQFTSLEAIGISFNDKGKLQLDSEKLGEALADDPAGVERFFTDKTLGVSAKLKAAIERLAGEDNSALVSRAESLADIIKTNAERIAFMDERLTRERERLLLMFAQLESTIAGMQQNLTALAGLQIIPPLTSTSRK